MNLFSLKAQENSSKLNNGLTHIMSAEEKLHANEIGKGFLSSAAPLAPVRNIAEFEPTEAAIISYSGEFGIPYSLIKDLSNDTKVIVVVPSSSQTTVNNLLQSNGVNMANVQYLNAAVDSYWARDYSGWFIADGNNKVGIVDFVYNRPRANDDAIPAQEATFLNIQSYAMNLTTTGGNWMCDGMGIATSTDLVWDENTSLTHIQINQNVKDYLGITNYMVVADPQGQYIKHMDCWGKFLAVDKILVDSVPSSDTQFNAYQAAAAYYRNTNCSYGYPYKVFRPYIVSSANGEPYSNSFICNNNVYLAFIGSPNDNAALNLYKVAMPGYTVKGYTQASNAPWVSTDALHCRVHEIADRKMLYIKHMPLFGKVCSLTGYTVSTDVISYDAQTIKTGYPMVIYKLNGGAWDSISMALVNGSQYTATIPYQPNGTTVQYYIKAIDAANKIAYHPFIGAPDPHTFVTECTTGVPTEPQYETYFSTYPNPNDGNFFVYLNSKRDCPATVKINNALGETVYNETYDLNSGISLKHIELNNISKGIYFIEFKTDFETITKKLVIQ